MTRMRQLLISALSLALFAGVASAQEAPPAPTSAAAAVPNMAERASLPVQARLPAARAGGADFMTLGDAVQPARDASLDGARANIAQGIRHRGQGMTMMIVGGAGVLTGLIIDEQVITIVGAVVWLYGLYLYVR